MDNVERLEPRAFTKFCMSIGAVPSSYIAGLTIEEQLLWFCSYLEKEVIPAVNNNAGAVEELQALYLQLKDYVDHYFDNLDVQEEIDNKLDEMVESGELLTIISNYLKQSLFIDITTNEFYDNVSKTKYYITEIPYQDEQDNRNILNLGIAYDDTDLDKMESTIDFAFSKCASVCINAGINDRTLHKPHGIVIQNGVVLQDETFDTYHGCQVLGIKPDGSFETFNAETTEAQEIINAGCTNAVLGWATLIEGGVSVAYSISGGQEAKEPRQVIARKTNGNYVIFTCDGREENNEGMTISDLQRLLQAYGNIDFAYNLDGGGSTSTVIDLQKINENIDEHYQDREVCTFLYFARNPLLENPDMEKAYKLISKLRQAVIEANAKGEIPNGQLHLYADGSYPTVNFYQDGNRTYADGVLRVNEDGLTVTYKPDGAEERTPLLSATSSKLRYKGDAFGKFYNYGANNGDYSGDVNNITDAGFYFLSSPIGHKPSAGNYVMLAMPNSEDNLNRTQIAIPNEPNRYIFTRKSTSGASGAYGDWAVIAGCRYGTTAQRPSDVLTTGMMYFDTDLGKPIWYSGSGWVDSTGASV